MLGEDHLCPRSELTAAPATHLDMLSVHGEWRGPCPKAIALGHLKHGCQDGWVTRREPVRSTGPGMGGTLGPWSVRSPATTKTSRATGLPRSPAVTTSTSATCHRSSSEGGCWKKKGGPKRSGQRSTARSATEPSCPRAYGWCAQAPSGASTRCPQACAAPTASLAVRGRGSRCTRGDCDLWPPLDQRSGSS